MLPLFLAGCVAPREFPEMDLDRIRAETRETQSATALPDGPLTLAMAIKRARATDGAVAVLRSAFDVAIAQQAEAGDLIDPELRVSYADETSDSIEHDSGGSVTRAESSGWNPSLGLRFFPPHPWARAARISTGTANANAARLDIQAAEWTAVTEISRLFTDIRYYTRSAEILDQLVAVQDDNLKLFQERAKAATELEVLNASQRRLQTLAARDKVRRSLRESQRLLTQRVNLPLERLVLAEPNDALVVANTNTLTGEQLSQKALTHRADLAALYWRNLAAQSVCDEVRSERIPWFNFIEVSCASDHQHEFADEAGSLSHRSTEGFEWRVQFGITLPLFTWSNHTLALREAEQRQAEVALREAVANACRTIEDALTAMQSSRERQMQYDVQSEPALREFEASLPRLTREPGVLPEQIVALREQLLNLRRSKLEQEYEYQKSVSTLEETVGTWLAPVESR